MSFWTFGIVAVGYRITRFEYAPITYARRSFSRFSNTLLITSDVLNGSNELTDYSMLAGFKWEIAQNQCFRAVCIVLNICIRTSIAPKITILFSRIMLPYLCAYVFEWRINPWPTLWLIVAAALWLGVSAWSVVKPPRLGTHVARGTFSIPDEHACFHHKLSCLPHRPLTLFTPSVDLLRAPGPDTFPRPVITVVVTVLCTWPEPSVIVVGHRF